MTSRSPFEAIVDAANRVYDAYGLVPYRVRTATPEGGKHLSGEDFVTSTVSIWPLGDLTEQVRQ
jgi:hypothetical protein